MGEDVADEVVLAVIATEPDVQIEIHCHGGQEVTRLLLELLAARGLKVCSWEEVLEGERCGVSPPISGLTGGLTPRCSPVGTNAFVALARATTVRTAVILLDQSAGALDRAVEEIVAALRAGEKERGRTLLSALVARASLSRHLTSPWRVVVAGAPNVGKSSLVNALAGYERSIIAPTPGTTRDLVSTQLAIDGWPVEVVDTAGLREGGEVLEEMGIEQARAAATAADLVLWLVDASVSPVWPTEPSDKVRLVVNKVDLPCAWQPEAAGDAPRISATTGQGMTELLAAISRWLVPDPPAAGSAVPFTAEQIAGFTQALGWLDEGEIPRVIEALTRASVSGACR
jgi:tRNA modification GTPase